MKQKNEIGTILLGLSPYLAAIYLVNFIPYYMAVGGWDGMVRQLHPIVGWAILIVGAICAAFYLTLVALGFSYIFAKLLLKIVEHHYSEKAKAKRFLKRLKKGFKKSKGLAPEEILKKCFSKSASKIQLKEIVSIKDFLIQTGEIEETAKAMENIYNAAVNKLVRENKFAFSTDELYIAANAIITESADSLIPLNQFKNFHEKYISYYMENTN